MELCFLFLFKILITGGTNDLSNCNKSPHVFISTGDHTLRCHTCHKCPKEMGMSIKCEKQVMSTAVNIACVDCVAGVNYSSTNDYSQCKPCPKICNDQEIRGECAKDGDHRKCIPCRQNWYYDRIKAKCLPCSCWNMSQEAKQKCSDNGFSFELHCKKPEVKLTTPRPADVGNSTKSSNASKIILIISSVGICGYCCFAGMRLIKFKMMKSRWPVGAVEWVSSVFCCHYCVAHCECHTEPENPEIVNGR